MKTRTIIAHKVAIELNKTSKAYHEMKIAKHKYKIALADKRLAERLGIR